MERDPLDLVHASRRELEGLLRGGVAPSAESLAGWVFRGWNTLWLTRLVGIRKFAKGFYRGRPRASGPPPILGGYNVVVRQNADAKPHVEKPSPERPKRHAFYGVYAPTPRYPNALFLDYARGGNGLHPAALLRDYLVEVVAGEPNLLLGKAYVSLGVWIPVSYFVLSRWKESDFAGTTAS